MVACASAAVDVIVFFFLICYRMNTLPVGRVLDSMAAAADPDGALMLHLIGEAFDVLPLGACGELGCPASNMVIQPPEDKP